MRKIQTALASVLCLLFPLQQMSMLAAGQDGAGKPHPKTESPIKHVIVIIGENRTFDHIFGLYQPPSGFPCNPGVRIGGPVVAPSRAERPGLEGAARVTSGVKGYGFDSPTGS